MDKVSRIRPLSACNFSMLLVLFFLLLSETSAYSAELVIITNPKSGVGKLSHDEAVDIFMGRSHQLASGLTILPIDLPADQNEKADFYRLLINKSPSEVISYWARLHFSGRNNPPTEAKSISKAIEFVSQTPGAFAYVKKSMIDDKVRVVFEVNNEQ